MTKLLRRGLWVTLDICVIGLALWLAYIIRFDAAIPARRIPELLLVFCLAILIKVPVFSLFRLYRFSWRHAGIRELYNIGLACFLGSSALAAFLLLARDYVNLSQFPRSVLVAEAALCLIGVAAIRFSWRLGNLSRQRLRESRAQDAKRTIVVGAGDAGSLLARAMSEDPTSPHQVVGFLDDDPAKQRIYIHGIRVLGPTSQLARWVSRLDVCSVVLAMPSVSSGVIRETVDAAKHAGVGMIRILPHLSQLYSGRISASELREVRLEDFLQRDPVQIESDQLERFLRDRCVLVTGAAGSIGSEICRQVLRFGAGRLIALDFNETGLFDLEADLRRQFPEGGIHVVVADVRDRRVIDRIFERERPSVVYHAAAYKHVPMMEAFPAEAVKANIVGSRNVLEASCQAQSEAFVLISTDKAVEPTSVMGATKRVAEMVVHAHGGTSATRCVAVRFGNVLGSRGSVLHTFQSQIRNFEPITITHPDMTRYFMVLSEAVQLVLQASLVGSDGNVLVLDMGEPVRIVELAEDLIRFHGLKPHEDIPLVTAGIRPGEKLHESLFTEDEVKLPTSHSRLFVAKMQPPTASWESLVQKLMDAANGGDREAVMERLGAIVPGYRPLKP